MRLYVGMDLHSTNCYTGIIDETSRVLFDRKLPNDRQRILAALVPYKEHVAGLAVESTYNWYWLVDALMEEGYRVHLANPAAMSRTRAISTRGITTNLPVLVRLPMARPTHWMVGE